MKRPEVLRKRSAHAGNAWEQLSRGDFSGAAMGFKIALADAPENAGLWKGLGAAQVGLKKNAAAAYAFEQALRFDPTDIESACYGGEARMALQHLGRALELFKVCLALDPNAERSHGVRARMLIHRMTKKVKDALK